MLSTTEAIILKSVKYRDSSKLLTAYTEEFGRCSFVANGARKAKNKFGVALEPMSCSRLSFYKRAGKDLHTLSAAEISLPLRNIAESFERLTVGLAICEIVYATQTHEERNKAVFGIVRETLRALNAAESNERSVLYWFQVHYAERLGFRLAPGACAQTGVAVNAGDAPEFVVSLADGAPYAPSVSQRGGGFTMDAASLEALQRLAAMPASDASSLALSEAQHSRLHDFFALYYRFHLDRDISARAERFQQSFVNF
jgi:DNA repair protein RecO (recombination protein O)